MTPASEIIERCGGFKAVADWLGLERTAVQRWTYDAPKGTGGQIPTKHWAPLIEAARENGIEIALAELMPADVARVAAEEARASGVSLAWKAGPSRDAGALAASGEAPQPLSPHDRSSEAA